MRYDRHHYSIDSMAAGRCVTLRSYADRIQVVYKDQVVAEHIRSFKRDGITYDPWHYVDALQKKPGALRDGAPFKQWNDLSQAITRSLSDLSQSAAKKLNLALFRPLLCQIAGAYGRLTKDLLRAKEQASAQQYL